MVAPGTHATEAAGKHTLPLHYVLVCIFYSESFLKGLLLLSVY